jgi:hypothetical protein
MKTKALVAVATVAAALAVQAEEQPTRAELLSPESLGLKKNYVTWDDPKWWETMRVKEDRIAIGRSDYTVEGPLVKGFRRPRGWSDLSPAEKLMSLPVIGWVVPQPMYVEPRAKPELADYVKWGERDQPWSNLGDSWITLPALFSVGF